MTSLKKTGLALLREPFPEHQISKLPKGTKAQNECQASEKINCKVCGGWHHARIIHLDYVGHAALTDRLLDCDETWNWDPLSLGQDGQPVYKDGGMWIKLTVCGVTRIGFGDSQGKTGPNAIKEIIGDALRNAAMRFGAALDLWHKGDLHVDELPETLPASENVASEPGLTWFNEFDKYKEKMIDDIKSGKSADIIIKNLRSKYKISKQIAEQIKSLETVNA